MSEPWLVELPKLFIVMFIIIIIISSSSSSSSIGTNIIVIIIIIIIILLAWRAAHVGAGVPVCLESREATYGQFSKFHVCFCGLDPGNVKFETVRTNKQHVCF